MRSIFVNTSGCCVSCGTEAPVSVERCQRPRCNIVNLLHDRKQRNGR